MEHLENKILKEKLDSVSELPAHYQPDLASKFDLVMQANNQPKKRFSLIWLSIPAAVAALFFFIQSFVFVQDEKGLRAQKVQTIKLVPINNSVQKPKLAIGYPMKKKPVKKVMNSKFQWSNQHLVSNSQKPIELAGSQKQIVPDSIAVAQNDELKIKPISKHKNRFIEIDFVEPSIQQVYATESKKESAFIKFKLPENQLINTFSPEHNLSYKQSF